MPILLTALLACKHYDSVDEACADDVPGENRLDGSPTVSFSLDFALRQNCYRRYVGLSQVHADPGVQYAVEQHAEYLGQVDLDEVETSWGTEVTGPEYYGADVFERLDSAGYPYDVGNYGIWELLWTLAEGDAPAEDVVDAMMRTPNWHEIMLQFEPRAVAAVQGVDTDGAPFVYANLVYDFPASEWKTWVTWPQDGQTEVPIYSTYGYGTALSITVGATSATSTYNGENPYAFDFVRVPQLVGPDGPVPVSWYIPGQDPELPLRYSAAGEPARPLDPATTYSLDGEFRWEGGEKSFRLSFETAAETGDTPQITPSARMAPRMRNHPPAR
jgi:hypothetical protein